MKIPFGFSLLILLFNLLMIHQYGTDVPFWDQWDSEAELYIGWEEQTLTFADLIAPHVQHRLALSRILRLILYETLGGWSPLANMIFQTLLVPMVFLALFGIFRQHLKTPRRLALFYLISAAAFLLPLYWELILLGFQSHFYLGLIFALLLIRLAALRPSWLSVCGFVTIGALNLVTSASSPVPLLACLIVQLTALGLSRQNRSPQAWALLGSTLLLGAAAALLMVFPETQQQHGARNLADLAWLSLQAFSWPVEYLGFICLWILPISLVIHSYRAWTGPGLRQLRDRLGRDRGNLALLGFLLWLVLSIGSIAYARGHYGLFVSRYLSLYVMMLYVPLSLQLMFIDGPEEQWRLDRRLFRAGAVLYCLLAVGLVRETIQELERCRRYQEVMDVVRENLIAALNQNSPNQLYKQQKINYMYGAHPNPDRAFSVLTHPALRGKHLWLPKELRNLPAPASGRSPAATESP